MRWRTETYEEKCKRLAIWRPWFAWYPVIVDNERVWLEWVYRRKLTHHSTMDTYHEVQYADAMSILRKQQAMKDYDGLE